MTTTRSKCYLWEAKVGPESQGARQKANLVGTKSNFDDSHNDDDDEDEDNDVVDEDDDCDSDDLDDDDNDQFVHLGFEVFSTAKDLSNKEQLSWHCPSNQLAHHLKEIITTLSSCSKSWSS